MEKTLTHQAIALAGLSQAVLLVQQIARHGSADLDAMKTSIGSTLKIDADDILDVYGGLSGLETGLRQMERQLAEPVVFRFQPVIFQSSGAARQSRAHRHNV